MMGKFSSIGRARSSKTALLLSCLLGLMSFPAALADESSVQAQHQLLNEIGDAAESNSQNPSGSNSTLLDLDAVKSRPFSSKRRSTGAELSSKASALETERKNSADASTMRYKLGVPCVPLMLVDDPGTLIMCDREAGIKAEKRTLTVSRGKALYMVGKYPITVETQLGTVSLPGNSAAIIEQTENGVLRVDHLTGEALSVAVKRWKGTTAFKAASGDEICLAPKNLSVKEIAATDGVERQKISSEVGRDGISLTSSKFAPKTMLDKECLLQCDSNSFFQVRKQVYQLRKTIDDQELAADKIRPDAESGMPLLIVSGDCATSDAQAKPVTFEEPVAAPLPIQSKRTSSVLVKYNAKTDINFNHPNVTELHNGEALFLASKLSFVKTPDSLLRVEPGTLVLVTVNDSVTKVRNLWEDRSNGLCQTVDSKPFNVVAGDESLIGNDLRSVYLSASKDMVGRRLAHFTELNNGQIVHFSEVSLMSLVQSTDLLSQLLSSNDAEDKALVKKLNKMAAILVQITSSHGLYMLMQTPQWRHDGKSSASQSTI